MTTWPSVYSVSCSSTVAMAACSSTVMVMVAPPSLPRYGHRPGALPQNLLVSGTATQVPRQSLTDLLVGRIRIAVHEVVRGDHKTRGAEAALHGTALHEGFLHRVQLVALREPLHGADLTTLDLARGDHAGTRRNTVQIHRARAALALFTGVLRARESQPFTQDVQQALALPHVVGRKLLPVDRHVHAHACTPPWR